MRSSDMGWIRTNLDFPILWAFPDSLFRAGGVLASFQAFINVAKHYGSIAVDLDPRSKITEKTSWIQGLDPRSKIQDPRKNFLDPRSKIQDSRKNFLDPRSKIQDSRKNFLDPGSGSKIQDSRKNFLDPRSGSKIQDSREDFLDPQRNLASDLGKLCLRIQKVFPRILDLGSGPWIQEVFS